MKPCLAVVTNVKILGSRFHSYFLRLIVEVSRMHPGGRAPHIARLVIFSALLISAAKATTIVIIFEYNRIFIGTDSLRVRPNRTTVSVRFGTQPLA